MTSKSGMLLWLHLVVVSVLFAVVALALFSFAIWQLVSMFRKHPRGFLEAVGVLGVAAGGIVIGISAPQLPHHWREFSVWRSLGIGLLMLGLPLLISKNRLALFIAAVGFCAIRFGIAGVLWLLKHA
jgi:hypothetical protein